MKFIPANLPALRFWIAEALTVFANGALSGWGASTVAGAGTGALASTDAAGAMTPLHSLMLGAASALLTAAGNGMKAVQVWHHSNAIPNPFVVISEPPIEPLPPTDPKDTFAKLPPS